MVELRQVHMCRQYLGNYLKFYPGTVVECPQCERRWVTVPFDWRPIRWWELRRRRAVLEGEK